MAIAFVATGTTAVGTGSVAPGIPGSLAAEQLLFARIGYKYGSATVSAPSGWKHLGTAFSGGPGGTGVDKGDTVVDCWYRIADGTESGTATWTITGGNSATGAISSYSKAAGKTWALEIAHGADTAGGTSVSATADATIAFTAGDMALVFFAMNTDGFSLSSPALAATGATFGTPQQRSAFNTTQGDDMRNQFYDVAVSAGPASAAATFTATASGSGTDAPCGAVAFVRLSEVSFDAALGSADASGFDGTLSPGGVNLTADAPASATPSGFDATFSPGTASWLADAPGSATASGFDTEFPIPADLGSADASGFEAAFTGGAVDWPADGPGSATADGDDAAMAPGTTSWPAGAPASAAASGSQASLDPGEAPWAANAPGSATPAGLQATFGPGAVSWAADDPGAATAGGFDATEAPGPRNWSADAPAGAAAAGFDATLDPGDVDWPTEIGSAAAVGLSATIEHNYGPLTTTLADVGARTADLADVGGRAATIETVGARSATLEDV